MTWRNDPITLQFWNEYKDCLQYSIKEDCLEDTVQSLSALMDAIYLQGRLDATIESKNDLVTLGNKIRSLIKTT